MRSEGYKWRSKLSDIPEYNVWTDMKSRCNNPNDSAYHNYGKRGISVCKEWKDDFNKFLTDMGERPEGFQLDRIDNSKGYSRENCRWIDRKTNNRNRRNTRRETINGESRTMMEWSEESGVDYHTIMRRYYRGKRGSDLIKPL